MLYKTRPNNARQSSASTSSSSKTSNLNRDLHIWSSQATHGSTQSLAYGLKLKEEYKNVGNIDPNVEKSRNIELDLLGFSNLWEKPIYDGTCIDPSSPQLAMQFDSYFRGVEIRADSLILGLNHKHEHPSYTGLCQGFVAGIYQTEEENELGLATNTRAENRSGFSYPMERYLGSHEKHEWVLGESVTEAVSVGAAANQSL